MGSIEKLVIRFLACPVDLRWDEMVRLLNHFGYYEMSRGKTGGSRRKFVDANKNVIALHKPHPSNVLKIYQVRELIQTLAQNGKIKQ